MMKARQASDQTNTLYAQFQESEIQINDLTRDIDNRSKRSAYDERYSTKKVLLTACAQAKRAV